MIGAVALSPSLDVTYVVRSLHGIQRPLEVHRVAGGKALNAARAAAVLGARVAALAVLGGGSGRVVAEGACADGVRLDVLEGPELTRTCVSILAQDTGELTEIYEHPTPVGRELFDRALAGVPDLLGADPGWCLLSGGVPSDLGERALAEVSQAVRDSGARLAVDSHGPALRAAVAAVPPDVIKVNRREAAELVGMPVDTEPADLAGALHSMTEGLAVVTDGTAGSVAVDRTGALRAALDGSVGSFPVGSGDSFLGGLLVALDGGQSVADAMRLATATATANAQVPGAARFNAATVDSLLPRVQVTPE